MELTPIFQLISNIGFIFVILILILFLKSSFFKGYAGEWVINSLIKRKLDPEMYHLFKDVTLSTGEGTTQIDHIIVSIYGVFVIETKNMKGWIFGNAKQSTWTQTIYKHKSKFQNPLHQNYKHIKTVQSLLSADDNQLHSLVVFVGDAKFKTDMPDNIVYANGFINFIKSKDESIVSLDEVNKMCMAIEAC